MKKKILLTVLLVMSVSLAACSAKDTAGNAASTNTNSVAQSQTNDGGSASENSDANSTSDLDTSSNEDDDNEEALFRSTAYVVQNEITTGLTVEYLTGLLNYPVTVDRNGEKTILNNDDDVEKLGLDALYTEELIQAMRDADIENMKIENDTAIVGDLDTAYVVIDKDENDFIGIKEFHYKK